MIDKQSKQNMVHGFAEELEFTWSAVIPKG
jgi:hypothetical protein